jgi:hypothetical protein
MFEFEIPLAQHMTISVNAENTRHSEFPGHIPAVVIVLVMQIVRE